MTVESILVNLLTVVIWGIVLCMVNESLCDWLFGTDQYERRLGGKGLKGWIAGATSVGIVWVAQYDAIHFIQGLAATDAGILFSAGLVAGGSKKLSERFKGIGDTVKTIYHTSTTDQR